jgi:hypothetical protein
MKLSPHQVERLKLIAKTDDGNFLQSILQAYILEIKDECLEEKIEPKAAKVAISKLEELSGKLGILSGDTAPKAPTRFD